MKTIACPYCKKPVPWTEASVYRPFCSERCKLIDLGAWADGSYSIPTSDTSIDEDETIADDDNNEE